MDGTKLCLLTLCYIFLALSPSSLSVIHRQGKLLVYIPVTDGKALIRLGSQTIEFSVRVFELCVSVCVCVCVCVCFCVSLS